MWRLTSKRKNANAKQNTNGPAKSASSMICESTLEAGLRTASDFWRICDGLMPSSARVSAGASSVYRRQVCIGVKCVDAPSMRLGSPSKPPVPNASHHLPEPERMLPDAMFMFPDILPMLPMGA